MTFPQGLPFHQTFFLRKNNMDLVLKDKKPHHFVDDKPWKTCLFAPLLNTELPWAITASQC